MMSRIMFYSLWTGLWLYIGMSIQFSVAVLFGCMCVVGIYYIEYVPRNEEAKK